MQLPLNFVVISLSSGYKFFLIAFTSLKLSVKKEWVSASEDEIKEAIRLIANQEKQIIEGAAGVSVASFLKMKDIMKGSGLI